MRAPSPPPTTQPVQRSVELAGGSTSEVTLHSGSELVQHTTLEAAIDMRAAVDEVLALLSGASAAAGGGEGGLPPQPSTHWRAFVCFGGYKSMFVVCMPMCERVHLHVCIFVYS